jgi:predicted enzyme related to lactoylglutathione lyase
LAAIVIAACRAEALARHHIERARVRAEIMAQAENDRRIDYIELGVADVERAKVFHGKAFDWTFTDYGPAYCEFSDGRLHGGFTTMTPPRPGGPLVILYAVDLVDAQARVEAAGGRIAKPIFDFPRRAAFPFSRPRRLRAGGLVEAIARFDPRFIVQRFASWLMEWRAPAASRGVDAITKTQPRAQQRAAGTNNTALFDIVNAATGNGSLRAPRLRTPDLPHPEGDASRRMGGPRTTRVPSWFETRLAALLTMRRTRARVIRTAAAILVKRTHVAQTQHVGTGRADGSNAV